MTPGNVQIDRVSMALALSTAVAGAALVAGAAIVFLLMMTHL
jgi:hypothetical protein